MTEKIKEKFSAYIEKFKPAVFVLPSVIIAAFSVGGFYIGSGSEVKNSVQGSEIKSSVKESRNSAGDAENSDSAEADKKLQKVSVVSTVKKTTAKSGKPADGVFEGSSVCEKFGYTVSLKAKFKAGKPAALYGMKILNNSDSSNDAYMSRAWRVMVKRIIGGAANNGAVSDVDSVSGATYSSNAIVSAYLDARNKAIAKAEGKKLKATPKPTAIPSKKPAAVKVPEPDKIPSGDLADGKYRVSAVCEPDKDEDFEKYTLSATFTFKNGKCTAISDFSSTAESNKNYYMKAANGNDKTKGMVSQIIQKQSVDGISAVSGATCSSKTIAELYVKALEKSAKKAGVKNTPTPSQSETPRETDSSENTVSPSQTPSPSQSEEPTPAPSLIPLNSGTYKETVTVYPDESKEFHEYTLTADVIFNDNYFCGFDNVTLSDETNRFYYNKAANGTKTKPGIISQINEKQSDELDGVSGATCTSNALIELFSKAWNEAKKRGLE